MTADNRAAVYHNLHHGQLTQEDAINRSSARRILKLLLDYVSPRSVLDVGCGVGSWLAVARELGFADVRGLEGNWLDPAILVVDPALISKVDLEQRFSLGRRFDLAVCLEVAEHLQQSSADNLVQSLVEHSDLVLFSAAIPLQGGTHHVNEQFPDYWAAHFGRYGYRVLDFIRASIWADPGVIWWLRQNVLVFAHQRALDSSEKLRSELGCRRPLSIVHPELFLMRLRSVQAIQNQYDQLANMLSQGGTFTVASLPDGKFTVAKQ